MLRLSQDEALRQELIAAGYRNVQRFSWAKAAAEPASSTASARNTVLIEIPPVRGAAGAQRRRIGCVAVDDGNFHSLPK
jgi:hypothetical protein